ncbi:MAG TPA: hypothetical protein VGD94_04245, partial [Vicinamibacterales bacterium]
CERGPGRLRCSFRPARFRQDSAGSSGLAASRRQADMPPARDPQHRAPALPARRTPHLAPQPAPSGSDAPKAYRPVGAAA